MAMYEALIIAVPAAMGLSLAVPKEYSPALSVLLASLGAGSGLIGRNLAREGQSDAALIWDVASMFFGMLSLMKSLELI